MAATTIGSTNDKLHIVMLPWLAFGHMIPYLELAKLLAQRGHKISFVSTPNNIDRLPKLPQSLSSQITFVKIPLPHVPNLPHNSEATIDLPYNKVQYLKQAYDLLQEPITHFLESIKPDWLLHDFVSYWASPVARELGIATAFFSIFIAAVLCNVTPTSPKYDDLLDDRVKPRDFTVPPKWIPFPTNVTFRLFEIKKIFDAVTGNVSGVSDNDRFKLSLKGSDALLVRSCFEFEPEWLNLLQDLQGKPVIPVGQIPTTPTESNPTTETWREIKLWLDGKDRSSVLYVAFGSEAKPSQDEVNEIALGIELSGLPFFWVFRTHRGNEDEEIVKLPDGFEERTKGRGVVWTSWAPQLSILSHDSVGGFLSHSGWSSVVEAIQFGKCLILLTFLSDQGINAKILEEKRMGYVIPREEDDGSFTRSGVAEAIRFVMVEDGGKIYRHNIKEMKRVFGDRDLQARYVDDLLSHLCKKEKNYSS